MLRPQEDKSWMEFDDERPIPRTARTCHGPALPLQAHNPHCPRGRGTRTWRAVTPQPARAVPLSLVAIGPAGCRGAVREAAGGPSVELRSGTASLNSLMDGRKRRSCG